MLPTIERILVSKFVNECEAQGALGIVVVIKGAGRASFVVLVINFLLGITEVAASGQADEFAEASKMADLVCRTTEQVRGGAAPESTRATGTRSDAELILQVRQVHVLVPVFATVI